MSQTIIHLHRAYDAASPADGYRIFVDRLWPRGLSHATFHYDLWPKEISPSTELRQWFHADPAGRWTEFVSRYKLELAHNPVWPPLLASILEKPVVTLIFASHDVEHNEAVILREVIEAGQ